LFSIFLRNLSTRQNYKIEKGIKIANNEMKLNKQWNTLSNQIKKIKILKKKAKKEKYDKIKMNSNKSNSSS
jgi:hypothetical protein